MSLPPRGHVAVTQTEGVFHNAKLNGDDVSRFLRGVNVSIAAGEVPAVTLDLIVEKITLDFPEARLYLADGVRELLTEFGWTPPAEEISA